MRAAKSKSKPSSWRGCSSTARTRVAAGGCWGPRAGPNTCLPAASAHLAPCPLARARRALQGFFPRCVGSTGCWRDPADGTLPTRTAD